MRLVALSPDSDEFQAAMYLAWEWTQVRKRFYCETGGNQTFEEYMADAKAPNKKQIAAIVDNRMTSLITVRLVASGDFEIHLTSKKHTQRQLVIDALMNIRESLFGQLNAKIIRTSCPVYGKHEHRGSRRLAEVCGMRATGVEWRSGFDNNTSWREYVITRD